MGNHSSFCYCAPLENDVHAAPVITTGQGDRHKMHQNDPSATNATKCPQRQCGEEALHSTRKVSPPYRNVRRQILRRVGENSPEECSAARLARSEVRLL